jgi:hypothetical protein
MLIYSVLCIVAIIKQTTTTKQGFKMTQINTDYTESKFWSDSMEAWKDSFGMAVRAFLSMNKKAGAEMKFMLAYCQVSEMIENTEKTLTVGRVVNKILLNQLERLND